MFSPGWQSTVIKCFVLYFYLSYKTRPVIVPLCLMTLLIKLWLNCWRLKYVFLLLLASWHVIWITDIKYHWVWLVTRWWLCLQCLQYVHSPNLSLWCLTSTLEKKIDALDNWCLRRILHIHWMDFVSNDVVRSHTGQLLLSDTIRQRRLSFFGHLCCANTGQDHSRALRACIRGPPKDWRRRTGRLRQTCWEQLRMICARSTLAWRWLDGITPATRHKWKHPA